MPTDSRRSPAQLARLAITAAYTNGEPVSALERGIITRAIASAEPAVARLRAVAAAGELDADGLARHLEDELDALRDDLADSRAFSASRVERITAAIGSALRGTTGAAATRRGGSARLGAHRLTARADTVDFRDLMYVPSLVNVRTTIPLTEFMKKAGPILDQGEEGACTGFGLAAVVHYLLRNREVSDRGAVSPRMLYAMARRHDEWRGESYEGSSCRGAMKGWHKHGVCAESLWRHDPSTPDFALTAKRAADAATRSLGAYFRVNHRDLVAMHAALCDVGILYASSDVHAGWDRVGKKGEIAFSADAPVLGGHAFAIVAYDSDGFWIQNSWGEGWGRDGYARVSYRDWLKHGTDVWVARMGVPLARDAREAAVGRSFAVSSRARADATADVRPHVICLGNNGRLREEGNLATTPSDVRRIVHEDFVAASKRWSTKRLMLYAHGGLVGEDAAVQRLSEYRAPFLDAEIYPLGFVWRTDFWNTIKNILSDAIKGRRAEGVIDSTKDFLLDRFDDTLEPVARHLGGRRIWEEIKQNAMAASLSAAGGARILATEIASLSAKHKFEIHLVGHSAGSVLHAPLLDLLTRPTAEGGHGLTVESCALWAPACTIDLYEQFYQPALESGRLKHLRLFTLTDSAERDDHCAHIYNKSLLYFVAHAFERRERIPLFRPDGTPLLGMTKFAKRTKSLTSAIKRGRAVWVQSPTSGSGAGSVGASLSTEHGGFDDDPATVATTVGLLIGGAKGAAAAKKIAETYKPKSGENRIRSFRQTLDDIVR